MVDLMLLPHDFITGEGWSATIDIAPDEWLRLQIWDETGAWAGTVAIRDSDGTLEVTNTATYYDFADIACYAQAILDPFFDTGEVCSAWAQAAAAERANYDLAEKVTRERWEATGAVEDRDTYWFRRDRARTVRLAHDCETLPSHRMRSVARSMVKTWEGDFDSLAGLVTELCALTEPAGTPLDPAA